MTFLIMDDPFLLTIHSSELSLPSPNAESQPDPEDKRDRMFDERSEEVFYQFQIKDDLKAVRRRRRRRTF